MHAYHIQARRSCLFVDTIDILTYHETTKAYSSRNCVGKKFKGRYNAFLKDVITRKRRNNAFKKGVISPFGERRNNTFWKGVISPFGKTAIRRENAIGAPI